MQWIEFFQEKMADKTATIIAAVLTFLILVLKKVPRFIGFQQTMFDGVTVVRKGHEINESLADIINYTNALYVHIIRYHNGKKKRGENLHVIKMTVEWEEVGEPCKNCGKDCVLYKNKVRKVRRQWQNILINPEWKEKFLDKTVELQGEVNTVEIDEMNHIHQDIWKNVFIGLIKEVYIKTTKNEIYTLCVSFCERDKENEYADGVISLTAKQLRNYL